MTRYAALLRGVNVGGRTKIAMADLRAVLADLGLSDVRTLLNSGNAVFDSDADPAELEGRVEVALADRLGLVTRCLVRTGDDVRAALAAHPFDGVADDGSRMLAVFLSADPAPSAAAEHDPVALDPDNIRVGPRVVYQWCPDGVSAAPLLVPFLEKRWRVTATARNWNTVSKLADLL